MRPALPVALSLLLLMLTGCNLETAERESPPDTANDDQRAEVVTSPTPSTPGDPDPTPTREPTPAPEPTPSPTPEADIPDEPWADRGRLTVLLAGSDQGFYHEGIRTDAMIVASLDLETGYTTLFGIPRSFGDVPLSEDVARAMGISVYPGQVNWLTYIAPNYPQLAEGDRDPGMVALRGAMEGLLGIPVDYYAMVDMTGFVDLVDAIGGVELDVREPIRVRLLSPVEGEGFRQFEIDPGLQTLDGQEALAYARTRTGTTDYDRMERQRCVISAAVNELDLQTLVRVFPDLVDVIREHVVTDVPLEQLPDMVMLRDMIRTDRIISIGFTPPEFTSGETSVGHTMPDIVRIQDTVQHVFTDPEFYLDGDGRDVLDDRHC